MQYSLPCVGPYAIGPFAFINVKRYCGFFAVSIILKDLVIMFKTGIIGYWKYLKNKHWMQFMELSAIEANGI